VYTAITTTVSITGGSYDLESRFSLACFDCLARFACLPCFACALCLMLASKKRQQSMFGATKYNRRSTNPQATT
jgi:hypothetical protein